MKHILIINTDHTKGIIVSKDNQAREIRSCEPEHISSITNRVMSDLIIRHKPDHGAKPKKENNRF